MSKERRKMIEQVINSGLFSFGEESYFTWHGCDYEGNKLGATVYDCSGYLTLEQAQGGPGNLYEFKLCGECLNTLYYGGGAS